MRSPPPDMEQINIDASLVGLIIGRGGENLRRVEAETGARVQFMTNGHDRDSGGERVCNIQGTRPQIAAARRAIDQIIAENEKSGGSGPPPRKPAVPGGYGAPMMNQGSGPAGPGAPNLRDGGSFSKSRGAYTVFLLCSVWLYMEEPCQTNDWCLFDTQKRAHKYLFPIEQLVLSSAGAVKPSVTFKINPAAM
jgi:hypothetical protein